MREEQRMPTEQEIDRALQERHTKERHQKIKAARVAVAGLGGLGSNIALLLARAGVGTLHLVDFDRVDISNLNRQAYEIRDLGRFKTEALTEHIRRINPYIKVYTDTVRVTRENIPDLFGQERWICEAFDRADQKAMLVNALLEHCREAVIVSGSGMAGYGSSNLIQTKRKMGRLYLCGDEKSDISDGMCLMAPRVAVCAAHQANMALRLILGEREA